MELTELKKHWDSFAKIDPLWSILTDPTKKNNRWNLSEFFRTGVDEIAEVMRYVESLARLGAELEPSISVAASAG